mgnify:CR=1 FL=1
MTFTPTTNAPALEHEGHRRRREVAARRRELCANCAHPRHKHGKITCFAAGCDCLGGMHEEPDEQQEREYDEQQAAARDVLGAA